MQSLSPTNKTFWGPLGFKPNNICVPQLPSKSFGFTPKSSYEKEVNILKIVGMERHIQGILGGIPWLVLCECKALI